MDDLHSMLCLNASPALLLAGMVSQTVRCAVDPPTTAVFSANKTDLHETPTSFFIKLFSVALMREKLTVYITI